MPEGMRGTGPHVRGLGYVIVESERIDQWRTFGADLLGLQLARDSDDTLEFRADEKEYRLAVRRGPHEGIAVVGWEVSGPDELSALELRLADAGHRPRRLDLAECRERRVTAAVAFADPDGLYICELHYGLRDANERFASPHAVAFVVGEGLGLGHVFQAVSDVAAYAALYFDVLGFELTDHIEAGERDLTFTHCNRRHHSFAFAELPERGVTVGHLMLEVADMDSLGRAMDKVEAGAAPLRSTFGRHTNDKMLSIYVESPSGFHIEYGHGGRLVTDAWVPSRYSRTAYWGHRKIAPAAPTPA